MGDIRSGSVAGGRRPQKNGVANTDCTTRLPCRSTGCLACCPLRTRTREPSASHTRRKEGGCHRSRPFGRPLFGFAIPFSKLFPVRTFLFASLFQPNLLVQPYPSRS